MILDRKKIQMQLEQLIETGKPLIEVVDILNPNNYVKNLGVPQNDNKTYEGIFGIYFNLNQRELIMLDEEIKDYFKQKKQF